MEVSYYSADELIKMVLNATKLEDLGLDDPTATSKMVRDIIFMIHPDRCGNVKATEATAKLNELKRRYEEGTVYEDESGRFRTFGMRAVYEGTESLLKDTLKNYQMLMARKDEASKNFQKYLPLKMEMVGKTLEITFAKRSVPMSELTLEQKHVNWVYSRLLEFSAWLASIGYVHGGINPETVYLVPETHGIQVCSLCLMVKEGERVKGISGKYTHWYPSKLFTEKTGMYSTDMEMSARTAIYLLGDKSGAGTKLRRSKGVHKEILEFLLAHHEDPKDTFRDYREVLGRNFKKEFHTLNV